MTERARIRRGTPPRSNRPRPAIARRGAAAAQATRKAVAGKALATIPLPAARIKDFTQKAFASFVGVAVVVGLYAAGVPGIIGTSLGLLVGEAGFTVKRVEIQGIHHMDRLSVYSMALDQKSAAMPLVDLEQIRQKLLHFGWVSDARVSRRLPDTLLVDIVERQPAAIWQNQGQLSLIDKDGVVLQAVDPRSMPDLPIVVGPDANTQATQLTALLDAAPRLRPMFAGANWVGGRRWDVRFGTGETLALPAGDQAAREAYAKFDRMDQNARLLGQSFVRFDMRIPGKFVVRVSKEPGHEVEDKSAISPGQRSPAGTGAV